MNIDPSLRQPQFNPGAAAPARPNLKPTTGTPPLAIEGTKLEKSETPEQTTPPTNGLLNGLASKLRAFKQVIEGFKGVAEKVISKINIPDPSKLIRPTLNPATFQRIANVVNNEQKDRKVWGDQLHEFAPNIKGVELSKFLKLDLEARGAMLNRLGDIKDKNPEKAEKMAQVQTYAELRKLMF